MTVGGKRPRFRTRHRARNHGFTLLEVMISGVILLVGLAGMMAALKSDLNLQEHARHMTAAIHLGEAVMEELVILNSGSAELAGGSHGPRYFSRDARETGLSTSPYAVSWRVTEGNPIVGIRRVEVIVRWKESLGNRSLTLATWRK